MHLIAQLERAAILGFPQPAPANPLQYKRTARQVFSDLLGRAAFILQTTWLFLRGRMIVYSTSESAHRNPNARMYATPAEHPESDPAEWYDDEERTKPKQIKVTFVFGRAEVPDNLGKWLIAQGMAKHSRLILPVSRMMSA